LKIKFNHIRDLSDARYASALMAEWIGFSVGAEDSLSISKIQEILNWCSGPKIILELNPGSDPFVLQSYADVLPIDGFELDKEDFNKWKELPFLQNREIIVSGDYFDSVDSRIFTHNENQIPSPAHIQKLKQPIASQIWDAELACISLDCESAADPTMKNYDEWNSFFEELELL